MRVLELTRDNPSIGRARAFVFESPLSQALLRSIDQLAPTDATVLVTGETGTGKEIVARCVHDGSARSRAPFVAVNCGALTPSLIETELFGHERGAFTGAVATRPGWFEAAHGGTLFLDEVGDFPLAAQVKLLRVLQEREVVRVGARRPLAVDVRLIAATNVDLLQAVARGTFREDLYYRLHVAHLHVAPLRERPEDIGPLARHFLQTYAVRAGVARTELTPEAAARLLRHEWPGNIRELENVMHRAMLASPDGRVTVERLHLLTSGPTRSTSTMPPPPSIQVPPFVPENAAPPSLEAALLALFERDAPDLHREIEETVFRTAYEFCESNQLRTARLLGISRNIVRARLIQYGLLALAMPSMPAAGVAPVSVTPVHDDVKSGPPSSTERVPRERRGGRRSLLRVRVGCQSFGAMPLLKATGSLADALAERGAEVEWVECATGMQVIDALSAGALDVGGVGEAPPVFAQASLAPIVYVAAEPPAPQGEALVVRAGSPVQSIAELRGKAVAVSRGANVVYFVVRALEEVGLTLNDVDWRTLSPSQARGAFLAGEVDAWAIWNPILASLEQSVPTRTLRDARGLAQNRAFYVARRAFTDERPDVVEALVDAIGAVGRWANGSRESAARALAPHLSLSQSAVEAALAHTPFDARPLDADALLSQQHIADTFHRVRLIARPVNVIEAVWCPSQSARSGSRRSA